MKLKKKKVPARKKNMFAKLAVVGLCLALLVVVFLSQRNQVGNRPATENTTADIIQQPVVRTVAGTVNREPFFDTDLAVYAGELRAIVAAHYGRVYNIASMGASFWDTTYDDGTPREFLNRMAVDILVRNMVIIQEARTRGINTPGTYSDLEAERAEWNSPTDEIIFGPRTLGPAEYNSYRLRGITDALKTILLMNELAPSIAQLREAFDSIDDSQKAADFLAKGNRFTWSADLDNESIRNLVENMVRQGISREEIVVQISSIYPSFTVENFEVNSRHVSREDSYDISLANMLREAYAGTLLPAPENKAALYHLVHKEGGGLLTFEDAPALGRNKWINEQFEIFIDKKVNEAEVILF